jgi:hypothetical protein
MMELLTQHMMSRRLTKIEIKTQLVCYGVNRTSRNS